MSTTRNTDTVESDNKGPASQALVPRREGRAGSPKLRAGHERVAGCTSRRVAATLLFQWRELER